MDRDRAYLLTSLRRASTLIEMRWLAGEPRDPINAWPFIE
jgi:hypothetical protein